MWKFSLLLFALLYSSSTLGAESGETWTEVRSPHFTVVTDSNEKQARHIASQFERMRSVFHAVLPHARVDPASPIVVVAVKDRKGFQQLEPAAMLGQGPSELTGLFLPSTDKDYVLLRLDTQGEHPYVTVFHEYTHFLIDASGVSLPPWVDQGLAEFLQNPEIRDKDVELGQPSRNDSLLLRQNQLIPLDTFLAIDAKSPYCHEEAKCLLFYAESWAMVQFLETADQALHTHLLADYIELVSRRVDPVVAGERIFGDLKQFQKSFAAYVARANFQYFKVAAPADVNESGFAESMLSPVAANTVLADLLAHNGRDQDARALLVNVLHDEPGNAAAHETMGYLEFRKDNFGEALRWYQEAVKLDPQSFLARYFFAAVSIKADRAAREGDVETSLLSAIKINPKFSAPYDTLSSFYAARHEKLAEAHRLSLQAVELDPGNLEYRIDAADILSEDRHYKEALAALQVAEPLVKTPEQAAVLERRKKQIEEREAQSTRKPDAETQPGQLAEGMHQPAATALRHPTEPAVGPKRVAKGTITSVQCSDPSTIEIRVNGSAGQISLFTNDYYSIPFTAANYTPESEIHPCTDLEGKTGSVQYTVTSDKSIDGQIISIELSR